MQQQCQGVRRGDLVVRIIWHGGLPWDDAQSLVHLTAGSNGAGSRIGLPDVLAERKGAGARRLHSLPVIARRAWSLEHAMGNTYPPELQVCVRSQASTFCNLPTSESFDLPISRIYPVSYLPKFLFIKLSRTGDLFAACHSCKCLQPTSLSSARLLRKSHVLIHFCRREGYFTKSSRVGGWTVDKRRTDNTNRADAPIPME